MSVNNEQVLKIGDGSGWSFLNGPAWVDGSDGELLPPDKGGKEYFAVVRDLEFSDISARFRFRYRTGIGGVRFLFRLQDSMRYYAFDIPWGGQQSRNRHFWAGIVLADGTPLQRYLHFGLVNGICPEPQRWYEGRIECVGGRIRAWIDGRPAAEIEDSTYSSGRVGLMSQVTAYKEGVPEFADVRVQGTVVDQSPWNGLEETPQYWVTPCREVDPETYQSYPAMIQSKSGEITVSSPFGNPNYPGPTRYVWVRSADGGRSWSDSEPAPEHFPHILGASFVKNDGTWVIIHCHDDVPPQEQLYTVESADEGKTWSEPKTMQFEGNWPKEYTSSGGPTGQPFRLRDGTIIVPLSTSVINPPAVSPTGTDFVVRSSNDGETWSSPVRCDRNNTDNPDHWHSSPEFNEMGMAEGRDNEIIGFARPGPWPFMWQVRSIDGGRTWDPASFAPFPGYCSSLTSTKSGALVAIHRFPYLGANLSWDGGATWDQGTILDYVYWSNHQALEVEPDVVLVLYMGHIVDPGQADNRVLRLRVTENGLVIDD